MSTNRAHPATTRLIALLALLAQPALAAALADGDFTLALGGGRAVRRADMQERSAGSLWADPRDGLQVRVTTLDRAAAAPYRRTLLEVTNTGGAELALRSVTLLDAAAPEGARVAGDFRGSPVVTRDRFVGIEHPLAENRVDGGRILCSLEAAHPLAPGESLTVSLVEGLVPEPSQLRRVFQAYIERERARPYAPFLHHNTWYSLGYFNRFSERDELGLIERLGTELVARRGVILDAFVLDDGWDDTHSLWRFNPGWPRGLGNVAAAAARFGAHTGLWLSPWGGYGAPRQERMQAAASEGFEVRAGHFSLAGPRYYARFRDLCASVVRDGGVAYFKFDGIGNDETGAIDPAAGRDFDAMLRLVGELRALRPGLYVSQTTGTWPSPWWLLHVDNIWRGGEDHDFAGEGSWRQRWITYRDSQTYRNVVLRGPLYPLNSLMLHGILYARHAKHLDSDPGGDFADEVRSYFGSGTQLQELYLSPELLRPSDWDVLAAAAKWARANAAVLRDTHWIGGDPARGEAYGWAAWSPAKGIVTLRNPTGRALTYRLDLAQAFELPAGAPARYGLRGACGCAADPALGAAQAVHAVTLAPFETLLLEASPRG